MAKQINASNVTRGNSFFIPPEELIIRDGANARRYEGGGIIDLAVDILDNGQLVPILCRRDKEGRPVVIDGHRRTRALRYINEEKLYDRAVGKAKARCEISDFDADKEAFVASLKSNAGREDLTAVDHAHNIARMERFNMSREEIAKAYGKSQSWISRTLKLSLLPASVQRKIHEGKVSALVGYELAELPPDQVEEALRAATEAAGTGASPGSTSGGAGGKGEPKPTQASLRKNQRKKATGDGKPKSRTLKEIRLFWIDLDNAIGQARGPVEEFAGEFLQYMDGKLSDTQAENRLRKLAE